MDNREIREINDMEWEQVVERNPHPVFVMFFSPDCSHCTQMVPYVENLAGDFSEQVSFVMLNVVRYSWIAERFGVLATPTFMYFCGGKPLQIRVGAVFPAMLKNMIEEMIEHGEECRLRLTEIDYEITGYG